MGCFVELVYLCFFLPILKFIAGIFSPLFVTECLQQHLPALAFWKFVVLTRETLGGRRGQALWQGSENVLAHSVKHQLAAWNRSRVSLIKHPRGASDCQDALVSLLWGAGGCSEGDGELNLFPFFPPPQIGGDDNKDNCLTRAGRTGGQLGVWGMPTSPRGGHTGLQAHITVRSVLIGYSSRTL